MKEKKYSLDRIQTIFYHLTLRFLISFAIVCIFFSLYSIMENSGLFIPGITKGISYEEASGTFIFICVSGAYIFLLISWLSAAIRICKKEGKLMSIVTIIVSGYFISVVLWWDSQPRFMQWLLFFSLFTASLYSISLLFLGANVGKTGRDERKKQKHPGDK